MRARCLLYGRDKKIHESEKGGKHRPLRKLTSRIARKAKGPNFDRGRGRPPYLTAESKEKLREWMGECAMTHKCPLFQPEGQGAEAAAKKGKERTHHDASNLIQSDMLCASERCSRSGSRPRSENLKTKMIHLPTKSRGKKYISSAR